MIYYTLFFRDLEMFFPLYNKRPKGKFASFKLVSDFTPAGDQPEAIATLVEGLNAGERNQVLLGVTGSGKTFTMAKIIEKTGRPTLIMAPNKTLAAQLYDEMKNFFPHNHVEYFVSYYDYFQPEAYIPKTDTYIEKDSDINEQIDRMRHAATRSILENRDVIIVASVSSIYGIGSVESYSKMILHLKRGMHVDLQEVFKSLVTLQYSRNEMGFSRGNFRAKGDNLEIFPAHYEDRAWRVSFFGDEVEEISEFDVLTGEKTAKLDEVVVYANSHYVTPRPAVSQAIKNIKEDLQIRLKEFEAQGKLLESQRLRERTNFDIEMLETTGMCKGIENYSRYLTGRKASENPPTLFEYLPEDALLFIDESHVGVPQIRGMYNGDKARKGTLSEYGFRLPSCLDNRPLKFEEWEAMRPQTIFVSATPAEWELEQTGGTFAEQVIRPTGLCDPVCEVRPTEHQVDDLFDECKKVVAQGGRVLVTTLTKKMAEQLSEYLNEQGLKVRYMHSEIDTLERIEIIRDLRLGVFDILVGINLLREGLDIPECQMVCIMDADKEGFLRSARSLIQIIGRAARNVAGRVILYADKMTDSMREALGETERRRQKQLEFNAKHGITPKTINKKVSEGIREMAATDYVDVDVQAVVESKESLQKQIKKLEKEMLNYASDLEFEKAAEVRDRIKSLEVKILKVG